jgi:hypothetical protein
MQCVENKYSGCLFKVVTQDCITLSAYAHVDTHFACIEGGEVIQSYYLYYIKME